MIRDIGALKEGPFDLLIIGGGVYGAWTAYDASRRGLRVAIIDKGDWASGTSSASSKLVHGGLRYLEYFHFGLVRTSLAERRALTRIAPHRVWPLRFVIPVYEHSRVGRTKMRLGLWLYDRLAGKDQPVAPHESLSREELIKRCTSVDKEQLVGGFTYGDCGTDDGRLVLEVIASALQAGAVAANYVEAKQLLSAGGRVEGAAVVDVETGEEFEVRASVTVNAAGTWANELQTAAKLPTSRVRLTKGVHLVMPDVGLKEAMLLNARSDGRVFFVIPWYGRTLLGTTDTDFTTNQDDVGVCQSDIDYLMQAVQATLPGLGWTGNDVHGSFAGVRVMKGVQGASPSAVTREWSMVQPMKGLLRPVGGKLTSSRQEGVEITERVLELLGRSVEESETGTAPLAWAPSEYDAWVARQTQRGTAIGLDAETALNSARRYGTCVEDLFAEIEKDRSLARRIHADLPFCRGEIAHVAKHEMVRTLDDILRRRIPLVILAKLDDEVVADAADLVGPILGWSDLQKRQQISSLVS